MKLNHVYLSITSNVNPETSLAEGLRMLRQIFYVIKVSSVYESKQPNATRTDPKNWTIVVYLVTYTFWDLLRKKLRLIEQEFGYERLPITSLDEAPPAAPRPIQWQADILLFNNEINRSILELLPHPSLVKEAHIAAALAELIPETPHPLTKEPIQQIATRLQKRTKTKVLSDVNFV